MAEEKKKSLGMDENIAGLLCYVAGWISGLVFFLLEKENKFVRFHALQSIYTFLGLTVAMFVMSFIPIIGAFVNFLLSLAEIRRAWLLPVKAKHTLFILFEIKPGRRKVNILSYEIQKALLKTFFPIGS